MFKHFSINLDQFGFRQYLQDTGRQFLFLNVFATKGLCPCSPHMRTWKRLEVNEVSFGALGCCPSQNKYLR